MRGLLLLGMLMATAGCATVAGPQAAVEGDGRDQRLFIEESAVDVPERIDGATLINVMREAETAWGINAFYRLDALPEARLDLFVYPAGRMPAEEGARRGQREFVSGLEEIRSQGLGSVDILGEEPFPISLSDASTLDAYKTRLRVGPEDQRRPSLAYLTWRRDYFLKLRVTGEAGGEAALERVADEVARQLLPRAEIRHVGNCLGITIQKVDVLPPGQPGMRDAVSADGTHIIVLTLDDERTLAQALVVSAMRLKESGCIAENRFPAPAQGYKRQTLRFKPGDWKDTPSSDKGT
jgi:hypothetical protein